MPYEFKSKRKVSFKEIDGAGITHFSNFFLWMELTEHDFFNFLKVPIINEYSNSYSGWVRKKTECTYRYPVYFEDNLIIHLVIIKLWKYSIDYGFIFKKKFNNKIQKVAIGLMSTVYVNKKKSNYLFTKIKLPDNLICQLKEAPQHLKDEIFHYKIR